MKYEKKVTKPVNITYSSSDAEMIYLLAAIKNELEEINRRMKLMNDLLWSVKK